MSNKQLPYHIPFINCATHAGNRAQIVLYHFMDSLRAPMHHIGPLSFLCNAYTMTSQVTHNV